MANLYPTVGFHFRVTFSGLANGQEVDIGFQSVAGLDVSLDVEAFKEGGENRFEHNMPVRRKYTKLTLKRGLISPGKSGLTDWCLDAFQRMKVVPLNLVIVELLNEEHNVLMKWDVSHVWPISWKIGELNAERSEVLIETLELNYNRFELKNP
jgi:phage tail-like protein